MVQSIYGSTAIPNITIQPIRSTWNMIHELCRPNKNPGNPQSTYNFEPRGQGGQVDSPRVLFVLVCEANSKLEKEVIFLISNNTFA